MQEQSPHIVFIKTSTVEKIQHYQAIADAYHLPILYVDLRDIAGTQHVTDELEGTAEGNAYAKFKEFGDIPELMVAEGSQIHQNLLALCDKYAITYHPSHISIGTDDADWGIDLGSFKDRVGKLCDYMAQQVTDVQKVALADAIKTLLGDTLKQPLTADNLGAAKDSLAKAISAKYAKEPDHLQAFLDELKGRMQDYPLEKFDDKSMADTDGFTRYVAKDTLNRARNADAFPGPELAPTASAMSGTANVVRGQITGITEIFSEDNQPIPAIVPSTSSVVFQYQTLAELEQDAHVLESKLPLGFETQKQVEPAHTVKDFIRTDDGLTGSSPEYFLHHHPRTQIVLDFAKANGITPDKNWQRKVTSNEPFRVTHAVLSGASIIASDRRKQSFINRMHPRNRQGISIDIPDLAAQMSDRLRNADALLEKSDALVFLPGIRDIKNNDIEKLDLEAIAQEFMLSSCVVAKQLNLRDAYTPLIVLNHVQKNQGCYDKDFEIIDYLVQNGMCKDYSLGLEQLKPESIAGDGVTHRRTLYMDELKGTDLPALRQAAQKLLDHYRQNYYVPPALTTQSNHDLGEKGAFKDAVEKGEGIFKVGVFLSAGSENLQLNEDTKAFGKWLAQNEYGVVYGGGDRYMMGAVYDGYLEGRSPNKRSFIAGFSTPEIVKSETKEGKLPDGLDAAILNKDIYERMGQMIALSDDAIVIRPGGAGTVQEMASVLLMKAAYGQVDELKNKKIIIQNVPVMEGQQPFYNLVMERLFGDQYARLLAESEPGAGRELSEKLGIYVANDDTEIKGLIDTFSQEKRMRDRDSKLRSTSLKDAQQGVADTVGENERPTQSIDAKHFSSDSRPVYEAMADVATGTFVDRTSGGIKRIGIG